MFKRTLTKKVLAIVVVLSLMLGMASPAFALAGIGDSAGYNYASRQALEDKIRGYIEQHIEDFYGDEGLLGGFIDNVESQAAAAAARLVMEMLGGVDGLVGLVLPFVSDLLGDLTDFAISDEILDTVIGFVVNDLLGGLITTVLESDFFAKVLDRTVQYAVADIIDAALSDILFLYGDDIDGEIDTLAQKYANEIENFNIPLSLTSSGAGFMGVAGLVAEWIGGNAYDFMSDSVNIFHNIEFSKKQVSYLFGLIQFEYTDGYSINGWQNEINSNAASLVLGLVPGINLNDLVTMESYILARLAIDLAGNTFLDLTNFDIQAYLASLPDIIWNAFQRALKDVLLEYLDEYLGELEILLANLINDLLDQVFDWAFGYDEDRNAIRVIPANLRLVESANGIAGDIIDYILGFIASGSSPDFSWEGILDHLKTAGLGLALESGRVVQERLCYQAKKYMIDTINTLFLESCLGIEVGLTMDDTYATAIHKVESAFAQWVCDETACLACHDLNYIIISLNLLKELPSLYDYEEFTQTIEGIVDALTTLQNICPCPYCAQFHIIECTTHNFDTVITLPTCTTEGYTTFICTVCGEISVEDWVAKTAHNWSVSYTEPNCTEKGKMTSICTICGDTSVEEYGELSGHTWTEVIVPPTCSEPGSKTSDCPVCGDHSVEILPATNVHSWIIVVTPPTCAPGYTTHTCAVCGEVSVDNHKPPTGAHPWVISYADPTCSEGGKKIHDCPICGDHSEEPDGRPATSHNWLSSYLAPTCIEQGGDLFICSLCGDRSLDNKVAALGHNWDNGYVILEPTLWAEGLKLYTCTRCNETIEEIIPVLLSSTPFAEAVGLIKQAGTIIIPIEHENDLSATARYLEWYIREYILVGELLNDWVGYIDALPPGHIPLNEVNMIRNIWVLEWDGACYFMDPDKEMHNQATNHPITFTYGNPLPKTSGYLEEPTEEPTIAIVPFNKAVALLEENGSLAIPLGIAGNAYETSRYLEEYIRTEVLGATGLAEWVTYIDALPAGHLPAGEVAQIRNVWVLPWEGSFYFMDPDKELSGQATNYLISIE
ncbi:MAG: hypothetical protein FWG43_03425 [Clostridiales bacterium]|nr:hypothetical protein [Clostridiales bacterium]